jgi:hypothetical protein
MSDIESAGIDKLSDSYFPDNDFSFEDASFELNSPLTTSGPFPFRGYSTLTIDEERQAIAVAMAGVLAPVTGSTAPPSQSSSPEPERKPEIRTRKTKKRKAAVEEEPETFTQLRKRGHNAIEKRYRTNLNQKINELRAGVPSLCKTFNNNINNNNNDDEGDEEQDSDADGGDSKAGQQKYGKAAILTRALEYIKHLEMTTQKLGTELVVLKTRIGAFEKLALNGNINLNGNPGMCE